MFKYENITKDNYANSENWHIFQQMGNIADIGVKSIGTGKLILQKALDFHCDCWFDVGDELEVDSTGIISGSTPLLASAVRIKPLDDVVWTMYLNEFKNHTLSAY